MSTNSRNQHVVRRLYELLVGSLTVVGLGLILASSFVASPATQDVVRGIGLTLFPAGVVTFILSRFGTSITEMLLREAVETTIHDRLKEDMKQIDSTVKEGMDRIDEDMKRFAPLYVSCAKRGVENVHLNRGSALENFAWFLDAEARKAEHKEPARVWIVCSSLKGLLDMSGEHFNGQRMMEKIVQSGCDLQIMMTDPKMADLRAVQERRGPGEIPSEIDMNLCRLKRIGVKREAVKYYSGTPTVFAIATNDRMLLNPYPYQTEAFRCFSLVVYKTLDPEADIYHQYLRYHFKEPWERGKAIPPADWENLK